MAGNYDDEAAVRTYLESYWLWYMTDFEKSCRTLGARRAKALLDPTSGWSQGVLAEWKRAEDEVRTALEGGLTEFERRIRERVLRAFQNGGSVVNRCPLCRRVVRTPLARQCLWCDPDWRS
jgi:hypothetical protein